MTQWERRERMNIYVGNLSFDVSEENLQKTFEAFGQVASATIVRDKYSGQPRGFGFVEMSDQNEARTAIANLNGKELLGRQMNVNEARPRTDRKGPGRQGGGGGGRSGGYGRRRY
jgi:RNA recognition motif-containing protein